MGRSTARANRDHGVLAVLMGTIGVDDCFIGKKLGSGPQKSDGGGAECW